MIFVLAFFLCIGFWLLRSNKKMFLKNKTKFLRFVPKSAQVFFEKKWNFVCPECKSLIGQKSLRFLKQLDQVLCNVKYGCPKGGAGLDVLTAQNITLPLLLVCNPTVEQLKLLQCAKQLQNMSVVVFDEQKKHTPQDWPQFVFLQANQKQLLTACKNWCVPHVGKIKLDTATDGLNLTHDGVRQKMLANGYLLTKYQSKNFFAYKYSFFVGQKICAVVVQNKHSYATNICFDFVFDFATQEVNYFSFSKHKNYVAASNLITDELQYVCFSTSPTVLRTSFCVGFENSNLPCVKATYKQVLKPNQTKTFLFSQGAFQYLNALDLQTLEQLSTRYITNLFFAKIKTPNNKFDEFFNKTLKQKAMQEIFEEGLCFEFVQGSVEQLTHKYKQGLINATQCYFSIQKRFVAQKQNSFVFLPFTEFGNYVVSVWTGKSFKQIEFCKNNLQKPILVADGVKYVGQLEIAKKHLDNMQQIQMQY